MLNTWPVATGSCVEGIVMGFLEWKRYMEGDIVCVVCNCRCVKPLNLIYSASDRVSGSWQSSDGSSTSVFGSYSTSSLE